MLCNDEESRKNRSDIPRALKYFITIYAQKMENYMGKYDMKPVTYDPTNRLR